MVVPVVPADVAICVAAAAAASPGVFCISRMMYRSFTPGIDGGSNADCLGSSCSRDGGDSPLLPVSNARNDASVKSSGSSSEKT